MEINFTLDIHRLREELEIGAVVEEAVGYALDNLDLEDSINDVLRYADVVTEDDLDDKVRSLLDDAVEEAVAPLYKQMEEMIETALDPANLRLAIRAALFPEPEPEEAAAAAEEAAPFSVGDRVAAINDGAPGTVVAVLTPTTVSVRWDHLNADYTYASAYLKKEVQ